MNSLDHLELNGQSLTLAKRSSLRWRIDAELRPSNLIVAEFLVANANDTDLDALVSQRWVEVSDWFDLALAIE